MTTPRHTYAVVAQVRDPLMAASAADGMMHLHVDPDEHDVRGSCSRASVARIVASRTRSGQRQYADEEGAGHTKSKAPAGARRI